MQDEKTILIMDLLADRGKNLAIHHTKDYRNCHTGLVHRQQQSSLIAIITDSDASTLRGYNYTIVLTMQLPILCK